MPLTTLLIAAPDARDAQRTGSSLQAAALPRLQVVGCVACHNLVHEVVRTAPQAVVLVCGAFDAELLASLRLLADSAPRPVLVVSPVAPAREAAAELVVAGVQAWLTGPVEPRQLAAALPLALARFAHEQARDRSLADALARLDERKWVDRAKGMLMQHQHLNEVDAFVLLRTASMRVNLRVGEVSRSLVEAADAADAVNRAGQLRMLSQRLVKVMALAWVGLPDGATQPVGAASASAAHGLAECAHRLQATLDGLGASGPAAVPDSAPGIALAEVLAAWRALQAQPQPLPSSSALAQADGLAEALLHQAEKLVNALEAASGRRALRVVNLCGRQRMLTQRLAKQVSLSAVLPAAEAVAPAAAAVQTLEAFEAGLRALEQAPLTGDDIRATLARARAQWHSLRQGIARTGAGDTQDALRTLARESDKLMATFDQLTTFYEHSLQVLLG